MKQISEKELFETVTVSKAVAALVTPAIISQIVAMIYNLADTLFIGQLADPGMVAAVTVVFPWFNLLTALGNLFGIGGGSLISRMLGAGRNRDVKYVSAFSLYGGIAVVALFSMLSGFFQTPLLSFLGASADNMEYAKTYLLWVVVLGGVPTMLNLTLANLLRSEGHAKLSSTGMMFGGILNVILDPILIFGMRMAFLGVAVATMVSNTFASVLLVFAFCRMKGKTSMSLHVKYFSFRFAWSVLSVGITAALTTALANLSNMVIVKLASTYGDIPVAAYGIVKKIDALPLSISLGLCQGVMPLIGYNFASGNHKRMRDVSVFSWKTALLISAGFVACFLIFASGILQLFIRDEETARLGAQFLRIACLAVPLTSVNALIIYTLQAMGKSGPSAILAVCRQGFLNIPLLICMNYFIGLYGMIWTQFTVEAIMLPIALGMYIVTWRKLKNASII